VVVAAGLVAAAALCAGAVSAGASGPALATVSVSRTPFGIGIRPGFVGLAIEYRSVQNYIGTTARDPNTVFLQLLRNITDGTQPWVRIGGESTDRSWWPVPGLRRPIGITNTLDQSWLSNAALFANETNARLIMGLNLEANRVSIAQAEERQLIAAIGRNRIAEFEIGNEPELYAYVPWYYLVNGQPSPWYEGPRGVPVLARKKGYNFPIFQGEFTRFRQGLSGLPLAGPSTGNFNWLSHLPTFLPAEPGLSMVTFHRYGLNGCTKVPSKWGFPSVPHLLSELASRRIMAGVQPYVNLAHSKHLPFRIDEMASVTCGGRAGVSNTLASAMWYLDTLFDMWSTGVDGINIHTYPGTPSSLFDFTQSGPTWEGTVHPGYFGVLMFAQAAPPGSRLLNLTVAGGQQIRAWATLTPGGQVHVVLLNDNVTGSQTVTVREPWSSRPATLERLAGNNPYVTSDVRIGGQSFGLQTDTGTLGGVSRITSLPARSGAYTVAIPASNAAMLTWNTR
jgi:Glycosyl hydrolase family 79 C-terminal beta domain